MSASRTAPRMLIRPSGLCARARATEMRILLYRSYRRRRRRGGDCAATVVRSFGGGGVAIRRCGNITSAMPNHLVTRPSARHARMQQVSWPRSLEARDETDASQEFRALPRSRLRTLSFVEWGTFSCLGRNAVMPLCSLCDCPFLSPLPSTRPPRVGFGSRDAQIGLYCAGFITAARPPERSCV